MTNAVTLAQYGGVSPTFRNRIINGAMVIDQRNAGASVTALNTAPYTVDRFYALSVPSSKYTVQQNAGSVTPPIGFTNYAGITSTSSYSVASTDYMLFRQIIEGYNIADLGYGTANAKTVTLSFWVRSSLTGTFGGALNNAASDYSYPFSYTISSANTWTQISITIAGPTAGTWNTTNGVGIAVTFGLGVGSTYSGTAGAWASGFYGSTTGATSVVGTSGATFYITGVQLEVGSSATGFEYRQYGQELALCQRYYQKSYDLGTAPASTTDAGIYIVADAGNPAGQTSWGMSIRYLSIMRSAPSVAIWDRAGNVNKYSYYNAGWTDNAGSVSIITAGQTGAFLIPGGTTGATVAVHYSASSEL